MGQGDPRCQQQSRVGAIRRRLCCGAQAMSGAGQSGTPNHVRDDGSFPPKRSPCAGDGCAANHCQPRLLLVAELAPIADAGAGSCGESYGPRPHARAAKKDRRKLERDVAGPLSRALEIGVAFVCDFPAGGRITARGRD